MAWPRFSAWDAAALAAFSISCGEEVDPTPENPDGTPSYEFERQDLEAAEEASGAVEDYCADAVSEAQRLGCEAHVTMDEIQ